MATTTRMVKGVLLLHLPSTPLYSLLRPLCLSSSHGNDALRLRLSHPATAIRCASSSSDSGNKVSSRLSQIQQLLHEAEHRSLSADNNAPIPKITLGMLFFHSLNICCKRKIYILTCLFGFRSCYCELCQKWRTWGSECQ